MKIEKILINSFLVSLFVLQNLAFASISGNVKKEEINGKNQIIDSKTGRGIDSATVSIPTENYRTLTDPDGTFEITKPIEKKSILSVEKEGYRPFSITIDKNSLQTPLKIGIEETKAGDMTLENSLCHLGDNMYSSIPPHDDLSGSSPCTSPKHPVSCIEHRLAICFLHDSIHVSMPFSQIIL